MVPSTETILYLIGTMNAAEAITPHKAGRHLGPALADLFCGVADFAMFHAVGEIDDQADGQPHK
jgi:hypothetical protein